MSLDIRTGTLLRRHNIINNFINQLCNLDPILSAVSSFRRLLAGFDAPIDRLGLECIGIEINKATYSGSEERVQGVLDALAKKKDSA